ncbi:MAG TPA: TOMM precursor leader peptide-binding protein [Thermoanaerobaculia bacterium]|nr:TOMM precursor leader peptide-binding protein [Thermoanaerobaculia bacterium]
MTKIRLSPSASITPTSSGVVLRSDLGVFQLQGEDVKLFLTQMVPLLDGARDLDGVAAALPSYTRQSIQGFLELLTQKGLVEPVPEDASGERWQAQERFFQKWGLPAGEGAERLRRARVLVAGLDPWGAAAACELAAAGVGALHLLDDRTVREDDLLGVRSWGPQHLGLPRREALQSVLAATAPHCAVTTGPLAPADGGEIAIADGPWDLLITGLTHDDLFLLERLARFAHLAGLRSLHGHIDGIEAWIGPAVVPGETACWNCFRLRKLGNADFPSPAHEIDRSLRAAPGQPRERTFLAPMAPLAGHLLAMEALQLLTGFAASRLPGRLRIVNLINGESTLHGIVRMPWCELCGGAASAPAGGDNGDPRTAAGNLGSVRSSEELRQLLAGWVDPRVGVIRSLQSARGVAAALGELELPIVGTAIMATYTEGEPPQVPEPMVGSGKGLCEVDALVGAVGEAIERYSASRYRRSDLLVAPYNEIADEAFDPRRLCLYAESQYDEPGFPFARFDPEQPIHWARGFWLDDRAPVWVPALPAFFNFQVGPPEYFCQVSSNGLAAGASVEDAALRALFELIERDAMMLTWMCRLPVRKIAIDDSLEPGAREVARLLAERGIAVELVLLDAGIAIPTVVCLGFGNGETTPAVSAALACHPDPRVAARKAVLEQAHVQPYLCRILRESKIPASPEEVLSLDDHALYYVPAERRAAVDFLRGEGEPVPLGDLPVRETSIEACVQQLSAAGLRAAAVDVTSPDVVHSPFRVARALGTDIQPIHFGERFRRLGNPRLTELLGGRELNPHPHPVA